MQKNQIAKLSGYEIPFNQPFFNEFVVKTPRPVNEILESLLKEDIIAGYDLGRDYPEFKDHLLIAVTDLRTKEEIDRFVSRLEELK